MEARRFMAGVYDYAPRGVNAQNAPASPTADKHGPESKKRPSGRPVYSPLGLHHALGGVVVVVLQPGLVAADLPVELIDQLVQGSVKVFMRTFRKHVIALD